MKVDLKYKNTPVTVLLDDEDFARIGKLHFRVIKQRKKLRVYLTYGRSESKNYTRIYLHRFVLNINDTKIQVDHLDGNPLNNQKNNLRLCNNSINNQNRPVQSNNNGKYKGVRFHKKNKSYTAQIGVNRKQIYLGSTQTPEEAAVLYDKAAIKYFGSNAYTNFGKNYD